MIDGLIAGRMYGAAQERTGQSGKSFTTAKVRAAGGDGDSLFVNVIAFDDDARAALLTLDDGDSVALAGTITPKAWMDRQGEIRPALDMVAQRVLSAYHVQRKRKAVRAGEAAGVPLEDDADL